MRSMRSWIMQAMAGWVLVLAGASAGLAQAPPPGSYQRTCKDLEVRYSVLVATCQDSSGNWQFASLRDFASCRGDIGNQNGELVCLPGSRRRRDQRTGLPTGSYTQTCQDVRMNGDDLEARCQAANGQWKQTILPNAARCHGEVVNDDGALRCSFSEAGYGSAYNSYSESCRDIHQSGDSLQATCRRNNGDWHDTSLSGVSGCSGQIVNDDGNLRCVSGYAAPGQPGYPTSDVAYSTGYQDGLKEGGEDLRTSHSFRPHEHAAWQDADHNLSTVHMDAQQYKDRYRQGYEQGYQEGYGQSGAQADVAYNTGYQDGLKEGAEDRRTGHSYRPHEHAAWQDADHNLSTVHMDKQDYKNRYRQGYEQGYQQGYGR